MIESLKNESILFEGFSHSYRSVHMLIYDTYPHYRHKLAYFASGSQHALTIEDSERKIVQNRVGTSQEFTIYQLPADLIYDIAWQLKPIDLLHLLTINKKLVQFLRGSIHKKFWQRYHDAHFPRDFGPITLSYKTKTIQQAR